MVTPSFLATLVKRLLPRRYQARTIDRAAVGFPQARVRFDPKSHGHSQTEITSEMRAEAKCSPNGWLYVIKGTFGPDDFIPFKAIVGWWRIDASGDIIDGSYEANPDFNDSGDGVT
jgi:hypothetical protein